MNGLDLVVTLAAVVAAVVGWRLGFLTRALGWVGAAAGLVVAVLAVPRLLRVLDLGDETTVLVVGTLVLVLMVSIGQGVGAALGSRLRPPVRSRAARTADSVGGGLLGVLGVVVLLWLLVPVMAQTDGWAAAAARNSALARFTADHLPSPPAPLQELERQLANGDFPRLFTGLRPSPEVEPPPSGSPIGPTQLDELSRSVVRVEGRACDTVQSGSGFVAAPGLVVTNAHVVAGTRGSTISTVDGDQREATVVAFDPAVDLAVLRSGLDRPALPLARATPGDTGLVLGFPGGGPFAPSPFRVAELIDARGYDIYDRQVVDRDLLVLAAALEPGDSGSPVVRTDGTVLGVAVAVAPDRPGVAYALEGGQVGEVLARVGPGPVDTGPCLR